MALKAGRSAQKAYRRAEQKVRSSELCDRLIANTVIVKRFVRNRGIFSPPL